MSRSYQGAAEATIPIEDILRDVGAWQGEIVDAVGRELLKEVKSHAATAFADKSGKLRKSIKRKKSKFDKETHIVGAFMPHAHLIEHGHDITVEKGGTVLGHVEARPFLAPAAEAVKARLPQIVNGVTSLAVTVE